MNDDEPSPKIQNILRRDLPFLLPGLSIRNREPELAVIFYAINDHVFKLLKRRDVMDWMGYSVSGIQLRIVHRVVVFGRAASNRPDGMFTALTFAGDDGAARLVNFTDTDDTEKLMLTSSSEEFLDKLGVIGRMSFT